jgi:hypothetical protein
MVRAMVPKATASKLGFDLELLNHKLYAFYIGYTITIRGSVRNLLGAGRRYRADIGPQAARFPNSVMETKDKGPRICTFPFLTVFLL